MGNPREGKLEKFKEERTAANPIIPTQERERSYRPPVMVTLAIAAGFLSKLVV